MSGLLLQLIGLALLLGVGFVFGRRAERKHYASIHERETKWLTVPASVEKRFTPRAPIVEARLVSGSVVVSVDYYKRLLAGLIGVFGGEVTPYSSLLDRARREALLRMKEECPDAAAFINVRIETSQLGAADKRGTGTVEALAYGTALRT